MAYLELKELPEGKEGALGGPRISSLQFSMRPEGLVNLAILDVLAVGPLEILAVFFGLDLKFK